MAESRTAKGCRKYGGKRAARTEKRQASVAVACSIGRGGLRSDRLSGGRLSAWQAVSACQVGSAWQAGCGWQAGLQAAGRNVRKNMQLAMLPISR